MELQIYQGESSAATCLPRVIGEVWPVLPCMLQDVANRSFLKSQALYKTVDNRKTLEQQNALIAKWLDESLAARNKLYEANRKHHLEVCDMKRQIKSLEEERSKLQEENLKLQEQLQIAQACEYSIFCLGIALSIIITEISFCQVLQMTILDW